MIGDDGDRIVVLSGGVGGARFVHGLAQILPAEALTIVVNTGDDFEHWGLPICPDLDTVVYTLAGLADVERGWGLAGETFHALESMKKYSAEQWFALGDRDLATHLWRKQALERGESLSDVVASMCRALGVRARVLPMTDGARPTLIDTETEGTLAFQNWLVQTRAKPRVARVWFRGDPVPAPGVLEAIGAARFVLFAPSNPYVSIDPILSLPGVRSAVARRPVIAVSPIVGDRAVKGPLSEMIVALSGKPASAAAIARHYGELLSGFVVHHGDGADLGALPVRETDIVMKDANDRRRLANGVLEFARSLGLHNKRG